MPNSLLAQTKMVSETQLISQSSLNLQATGVLEEHLRNPRHNALAPTPLIPPLNPPPLPAKLPIPTPLHTHLLRNTAAEPTTSHAHGLAHKPEPVTGGAGAGSQAQHALQAGRQPQAEARQQRGQETAGYQGHEDEGEHFGRVPLRVVH